MEDWYGVCPAVEKSESFSKELVPVSNRESSGELWEREEETSSSSGEKEKNMPLFDKSSINTS